MGFYSTLMERFVAIVQMSVGPGSTAGLARFVARVYLNSATLATALNRRTVLGVQMEKLRLTAVMFTV